MFSTKEMLSTMFLGFTSDLLTDSTEAIVSDTNLDPLEVRVTLSTRRIVSTADRVFPVL